MTAFTEEEWCNKVIKELTRVLKPNGWLEIMEGDLVFNPEGPTGKILMDAFRSVLLSKSINPQICQKLRTWLSESTQLLNLSCEERSGPIGKWAGRVGELACQDFCDTLYALRGVLAGTLEKNSEEYGEMVMEFVKECNENKSSFRHFRFFCQKLNI
ncbi:7606_t:CDS:2 [Acaulospora colombiana]|uniref:7606_t:CDS:1 n=1 Tax=Acaulospora colombiana TaxID=27376 RepID=A0ACA9K9I3_9GLOM|nr:7606_t:CDS:2 [Acaulospora colombiana]